MDTSALGDPHNFGQRVHARGDHQIFKPRNVFWEWLFLSEASPLRETLEQKAFAAKTISAFSVFPRLQFDAPAPLEEGIIERLVLEPSPLPTIRLEQFESIGAAIALLAFFGISDLHHENIAFGIDKDGRLVFAPIDIESIFEMFTLPSQTHLLPSAEMARSQCGLRKIYRTFEGREDFTGIAAICRGYLGYLEVLTSTPEAWRSIGGVFEISRLPVRCFLRHTRSYYSFLEDQNTFVDPPIQSAEREQLDRSDIPYFFRQLSSLEVRYLAEPGLSKPAFVESSLLTRALYNSRVIADHRDLDQLGASERIETLKKAGVLQLARSFEVNGQFQYKDVVLNFAANQLMIEKKDQLKLVCSRNSQD